MITSDVRVAVCSRVASRASSRSSHWGRPLFWRRSRHRGLRRLRRRELDQPFTWIEEFDSPDALDGWNIFRRTDYNNPDALYTDRALSIEDGKLIITTQRHCVDEDIDLSDPATHRLLTDENAQVEPCGPEQFQKFTSGRVQSPDVARGEFDVSVTASFDTGDVNGVRSAIWMQNDHPACSSGPQDSLYGELDLIEHFSYGDRAPWSPSNTHLGCAPLGQNGTNNAPRELRLAESLSGQRHTWRARTSAAGVGYFLDDQPIDRRSWNNGDRLGHATVSDFNLSQGRYEQILDRPWKVILNQKVENAEWTQPRRADEDFPVRTMVVDRIVVTGKPFGELTPVTGSEAIPAFSSLAPWFGQFGS